VELADELLREFSERTRLGRLSPLMEIKDAGLVLGPGTILARMEKDARHRRRLVLDDEPRVLALLATTYEQSVNPLVLNKMHRAVELWNEGELALAQLHLIFAGLPHETQLRKQ